MRDSIAPTGRRRNMSRGRFRDSTTSTSNRNKRASAAASLHQGNKVGTLGGTLLASSSPSPSRSKHKALDSKNDEGNGSDEDNEDDDAGHHRRQRRAADTTAITTGKGGHCVEGEGGREIGQLAVCAMRRYGFRVRCEAGDLSMEKETAEAVDAEGKHNLVR